MLDILNKRYTPPSRLDTAPFGSIVYVETEKEGLIIYIQLSKNLEEPDWKKSRNLLEVVFQDLINEPEFIETCLNIFKDKNNKDFLTLGNIIQNKYKDKI